MITIIKNMENNTLFCFSKSTIEVKIIINYKIMIFKKHKVLIAYFVKLLFFNFINYCTSR